MDLGLGQGNRHAQYAAMAVPGDAHGHQHGTVDQSPSLAHTLVARIENDVGRLLQGPVVPDGEARVELLGGAADLGRRDRHLWPQQFDQNVGHLAGGDALHIPVRVKVVVALVMQPIRFDSSISTRCKLNRPGFRGGSLL